MKKLLNKYMSKIAMMILALFTLGLVNGCIEEELPGAGSMPDEIPPAANFSYASQENILEIKFTNLSSEALNYEWDFGVDGVEIPDSVLTAQDPTYIYPSIGEYDVTLIATDGLGVTSDTTVSILVVEGPYQPIILEAGFEDNTLPDGSGDGRDSWRTNYWTADGNSWSDDYSVYGISGSPVTFGDQAAKLEAQPANPRAGYQEIVVEADQNYDLYFWYTMKDGSDDPWAIVSIIGVTDNGPIDSRVKAESSIIASLTINDDSEPEIYVQEKLSFNSGTNSTIAIYFWNEGNVEARLDDFTIEIGSSGAVPPSVSFTAEQGESVIASDSLWLGYTFVNSSLNAATYSWDFGDGSTSMDESPVHTYEEAGTYTITLTATSEGGVSADFSSDITINAPVSSVFSYVEGVNEFTFDFTDESINAESLMWDFGDGFQSTLEDPIHAYSKGGLYNVTLVATSITGLTSESSELISIGVPKIINGDFSHPDGRDTNWKHGGWDAVDASTSAFNGSGDGSSINYDGTDNGEKTDGAKYTGGATANADGSPSASGDTRYAYQAVTLEANTEYYIEFAHALSSDGDRIVMEILDAQFPDDADGAITADRLITSVGGNVNLGKGNFTVVQEKFTTGANTDVAIWIWSNTTTDAWLDNVKILPAFLVEVEEEE